MSRGRKNRSTDPKALGLEYKRKCVTQLEEPVWLQENGSTTSKVSRGTVSPHFQ